MYLTVREGSKGTLVHLCKRKICTKQSSADFSQQAGDGYWRYPIRLRMIEMMIVMVKMMLPEGGD